MQSLIRFFGINNFLPHGYCLSWDPALLWTTVTSDATMAVAYGSYPIAVTYFAWKRQDLEYRWLYLAFFNGFILTCASTHLMSAITVWQPLYWLAAYMKVLSAFVAVATVFAVWWVLPRALNLPSPSELKIQRSAAQYARSLIEASLDPLVTISPEGKITDVNRATEHVTGRTRSDLIGTDFSDYFTEPGKARAGYQQVLREGAVTDYALSIRHQDGHLTDVLYNASLYRDETGKAIGVFAAARDITERKRAEEQTRERMKELQAFYHLSELAERENMALDSLYQELANVLPGSWRYAEIACARIVIGESEFRSGNFRVTEWMLGAPIKAHDSAIGKIEVAYLEQKPVQDEGPFLKEERHLIDAIAERVGRITERKRAEEELRSASLYARSLIEASLDPLVTISAEGKITDVNEAAIRATGIAREKLIGSDFSDYFTEPDKARAGYQEVFAKGFVTDYPLSLRHVSGKVMEVLYNASVYRSEKGEVAGVFAAARDITERKRAEEELRKYHEHLEELVKERTGALEAVNKDLEGFAYSVSHDLRTPLRAIDGFSNLLLKQYPDKLDDEGKRYLNVVRDSTRKMAQLIDDILAFSRMGRLGMTISEVDMGALARAMFDELKPGDRNFTAEIKPLPSCRGDQAMLRQVWINLLGNAIKFTRGKAPAVIEVGARTEGAERIYYVRDNGAGFDMQYAEKLFGVFQRLHGVEEFEGTGIGLAIVKRIIARHGGRVWAEGKVNEGATFYFTLPG